MQHVGLIRGRSFVNRFSSSSISITKLYASATSTPTAIQTSFLSNKIKVLTCSQPTPNGLDLHALALFVRAGPRFEDDSSEGMSYLVERSINHSISLLPPGCPSTPLRTLLLPNLEYQTLHLLHTPTQLPSSLNHISNLLQAPLELSELPAEAEDQEDGGGNNLAGEYLMDDLLHAVAFGGQGLGRRSVPTPERVEELMEEEERVEEWKKEWWLSEKAAERMVLVGVGGGLSHEHLVSEAEEALGWVGKPRSEGVPKTTRTREKGLLSRLVASLGLSSSKSETTSYEEMSSAPSEYVGGKVCLDEGGDAEWLEGGTQVILAFEGLREGQEDEMVLEVIASLLGGRKSYQPGGPGTGMQSRLFLNILAKNPSVLSAKAFNLSYSDSGLFGISLLVAGPPSLITSTFSRVVEQLRVLTLPPLPSQGRRTSRDVGSGGRITVEEVERAKNRTVMAWLMDRENGVGVGCLDDLAFSRPSSSTIVSTIASITPLDIQRVAKRILQGGKGEPTVVAMGPGAEEGLANAMGALAKAGLGRNEEGEEEKGKARSSSNSSRGGIR